MSKSKRIIVHAFRLGYRVLECGCVVSPQGNSRKLRKSTSGYPRFNVKLNGRAVSVEVHRLAAYQLFGLEAFLDHLVVRHMNDKKDDNRYDNLKLGTHSENLEDSFRNGIRKRKHNK